MRKKLVVAITGSSGSIYAKVLLDKLAQLRDQWEAVGVVLSDNAKLNWELEIGPVDFMAYPFQFYEKNDFSAPFASGSAQYNIMFIVPCSMGTLGRIANGISDDLITRSADVILKERRKLIVVARETPYNLIHIKNMETITLAGGIICPATPSFYSKPKTFEQLAETVVDRMLQLAGIETNSYKWGEM
jgi:4-hydroxy-3-polyprenylbenzoate decarboxylase